MFNVKESTGVRSTFDQTEIGWSEKKLANLHKHTGLDIARKPTMKKKKTFVTYNVILHIDFGTYFKSRIFFSNFITKQNRTMCHILKPSLKNYLTNCINPIKTYSSYSRCSKKEWNFHLHLIYVYIAYSYALWLSYLNIFLNLSNTLYYIFPFPLNFSH